MTFTCVLFELVTRDPLIILSSSLEHCVLLCCDNLMLSNNKYVINYVNIIKIMIKIDVEAVSQPVKTIQ